MSREIDALVAQAMGYESRSCQYEASDIERHLDASWTCLLCGYEGSVDRLWRWTDFGHKVHIPHYSTSIEAAWEIVEWWGTDYKLELSMSMSGWYCHYIKRDATDGLWTRVEAPTAPEAICLAFLKAQGVEVDG